MPPREAGPGAVARPERFERPTYRFVVCCSIQLSYGRVAARRIADGPRIASAAAGGQGHPMRALRLPVSLALLWAGLLGGCAAGGGFPDLLPRPHERPREVVEVPVSPPGLAAAEREALVAGLVEAEARAAAAAREAEAALRALEPALARARGAAPGSNAWADAQLLLSRLDQALAGYGEVEAMLAPLQRLADPAPADDPDRQRLEALAARVAREADALADRQRQAAARLG